MNWETALVGAILGGLLVLREWQNWRDRRDLLDRIMSADFHDYKRFTAPRRHTGEPAGMSDAELAEAEKKQIKC